MKENANSTKSLLARRFIEGVLALDEKFEHAFFRFYIEERMLESSASYVASSKATIISAVRQDELFADMNKLSIELLAEMGKNPALILLTVKTVNNEFQDDIAFEYEDMNRWKISRANGGTGIPEIRNR